MNEHLKADQLPALTDDLTTNMEQALRSFNPWEGGTSTEKFLEAAQDEFDGYSGRLDLLQKERADLDEQIRCMTIFRDAAKMKVTRLSAETDTKNSAS